MLRFDRKTWAKCNQGTSQDGPNDFVTTKTNEFLTMQKQLGCLDYNSLNSDRKKKLTDRVDLLMKDIAISTRKRYKRISAGDGNEIFDVSQRRNMHIKN